ncbi:MAG: type II secretion system F family protein [Limisphaerales bacterium]
MALFQYKAITANGAMTEGSLEAAGRQAALKELEQQGLNPVDLAENGSGAKASAASGDGNMFAAKKVTVKDLETFTRLLSSLLSAGLPLSRALVILVKETSNPVAKAQWKEIHDQVIDGISLADAMSKFPETFPKVYTAMVEAGETGGFLDVVLNQIAEFQSREKELKGKVLAAMLYPAILLLLALGVMVFLMVFFIPKFQTMFAGLGAELPLITQIIIGTSDLIRDYGLLVGAAGVVAAVVTQKWLTTENGRRIKEQSLLRTPILGPLVAKYAMARFCRMLGTLLGSGVALIGSLSVAARAIGNQVLTDAVAGSIEGVKKGDSLAPSLGKCKDLFVGSTLEMISVAEESSRLDEELVRISDITEGDLDRQLKTAVALTEPLMLFFIAAFIGTIFIGMVIPIFSIQDNIK